MSDTETETNEPGTEPTEPTEPESVETDDDDTDDEPELEPDEPAETGDEQNRQAAQVHAAQTEREMERLQGKMLTQIKQNAKRVNEIMGDDAESLVMCPLCNAPAPGFIFPVVPPPEKVAAVKSAIGEPTEAPLRPDTYSTLCTSCDGYGAVDTGSKVAARKKVTCLDCGGLGYKAIDQRRQSGAVTAPNGAPPPIDYNQQAPLEHDPPEVEALKQLGYIVVAPIPPAPPVAA